MDGQQIFIVAMTAILSGAAALVAPWLAYFWHRTRAAEQSAVLKKAMLDRGFTAEQIVQVIESGAEKKPTAGDDLFRTLTDNNYDADHIRLILAAVDRAPADRRAGLRTEAVKMAEEWYDGDKIAAYIESRSAAPSRPESAYA